MYVGKVRYMALCMCVVLPMASSANLIRRFIKNTKELNHEPEQINKKNDSAYSTSVELDYISRLRHDHTNELYEQRKILEQQYAEHTQKLLLERDELTAQLVQQRTQCQQGEQKQREAEKKVALLQAELTAHKQYTVECKQLLSTKEIMLAEEQRCSLALRKERDDFSGTTMQLKKEISTLAHNYKQQYDQKLAESLQEVTALRKKVQTLQERYQKSLQAIALKDGDVAQKDKHIAETKAQLRFHTDRISYLEHHVKELNKSLAHEQEQKNVAFQQARKYEDKHYALLMQHTTLQEEFEHLQDMITASHVEQDLVQTKYELSAIKPHQPMS